MVEAVAIPNGLSKPNSSELRSGPRLPVFSTAAKGWGSEAPLASAQIFLYTVAAVSLVQCLTAQHMTVETDS